MNNGQRTRGRVIQDHFAKWFSGSYTALARLAKIAAALSLIYGIGYSWFQFTEAKQDKRVEQSLTLFRHFNSAPFTAYREKINNALIKNKEPIIAAAANEQALEAKIAEVVIKEAITTDLDLIMDFYDGVAFCAARQICDSDVALNLFHGRAKEFYINFYQYINLQRQSFGGNEFGLGVETIVRLGKKEQSKNQPVR
jgi:hypothetical protein